VPPLHSDLPGALAIAGRIGHRIELKARAANCSSRKRGSEVAVYLDGWKRRIEQVGTSISRKPRGQQAVGNPVSVACLSGGLVRAESAVQRPRRAGRRWTY
jgi:hypothetical protein